MIITGVIVLVLILAVGGVAIAAKVNATRIMREADERAETAAPWPTGPGSSQTGQTSSTGPASPSGPVSSPGPTAASSAPSSAASPTSPSGTPTGSSTASNPGGGAPESKPAYSYTGRSAKDNRLYNTVFEAGTLGCSGVPLRPPPIPDRELKGYVQKIVGCLVGQLKGPVARQGSTLTTPKVQTYDTDISTPCGRLVLKRFPAFYCSSDRTIYVNALTDDDNFGYYGAEMGYWMIITHEFGHHLQNVSGVFGDYTRAYRSGSASTQRELSRRLELQATCFGGVTLNSMWTSLQLGSSDYAQMDYFNSHLTDPERDHGSAASNKRWFDRGYRGDWSSFGDCNTWTAGDATVA